MLIVMPFGHLVFSGDLSKNTDLMGTDLMGDVLPLVEKTYSLNGQRAMAGLSMGGAQTIEIGILHADQFPWLGVFSAGVRNDVWAGKLAATKARPKLLWVAMGKEDRGMEGNKRFLSILDQQNVKHEYLESSGGHTWMNWREYLTQFLPRLFR
jgi:enterochelin esterase family protein